LFWIYFEKTRIVMKRRYQRHYLTGVALGALWLSGCASVNLDQLSEPAQAAALQAFDLPSSAALSLSGFRELI
jgi:hypothetical protein